MGAVGEIMKFCTRQNKKIKPIIKCIFPKAVLGKGKKILTGYIDWKIISAVIAPYEVGAFPWGVNMIGPVDGATGLGQSFRLVENIVSLMGIPYLIYNYSPNVRNRVSIEEYRGKMKDELQYAVNLWHVNPSEFAEVFADMGKQSFERRYNIAFWLWELEEFPDEWLVYLNLLDEIWTPSEFISKSIRKKTQKPVYTIPYHITATADREKFGRKYFNLPEDAFLFLMMYDTQSIQERKNPEGVLKAFRAAFPSSQDDVGLVIKVNSANQKDLQKINKQVEGYGNIYYICDNLEKIQVNSLIANADVIVSLHRAEGFGLVLAEAMLNHVPVIATNWSANTEFMDRNTACMVDYQLRMLEKNIASYKKGSYWAEPDLQEAAMYMRKLFYDKEFYATVSENGYHYIEDRLGENRIRQLVESRLLKIKRYGQR